MVWSAVTTIISHDEYLHIFSTNYNIQLELFFDNFINTILLINITESVPEVTPLVGYCVISANLPCDDNLPGAGLDQGKVYYYECRDKQKTFLSAM